MNVDRRNALSARTRCGKQVIGAVLTSASLVVLSACGTRLSDSKIEAAQVFNPFAGASVSPADPGGGSVVGSKGGSTSGTGSSATGGNLSSGTGAKSGSGTGGSGAVAGSGAGGTVAGGPAVKAGSGAGGTGTGGTSAGGTATGGTGTGGTSAGGTASGSAASAACTSQGAPIVIGQDGGFSGLVGQSSANMRTGLAVWQKYINSVGGIQCHPVQLYQVDDASDPSKASANINDLVKNKHAIAIVGADIPIIVAAARSTADQLGVPIVGGDITATDWSQDPNLFPSGGSSLAVYGGAIGQAVKDTGGKKIGLLYCVEASICGVIKQNWNGMLAPSGGTSVFQQSISITQSSFTAECQNAKSAGVQVMFLAMDGSAAQRAASSCTSVGFHPAYAIAAIAASQNALNDPNLKAAGMYVGSNEVPFVRSDTPALQAFQGAFAKYYGGAPPDQSAMKGWASGQLFAAAINALGTAARSGPITTAMVYQGLYLLHNETLGGLLPPMNYVKSKPTPLVNCYATIKDTKTGIIAPNGSKFTCS